MRVWARRAGVGLLLLVAAVLAVPSASIAPLLVDDWRLDRVVVAVALDWRDFGFEKAQERLAFELAAQGIGAHVPTDACALAEPEAQVREVACRWEVRVSVPLVSWELPLGFQSVARIDRNGVLVH